MNWFALWPVRLTNGRLAWLCWVRREVVDNSQPYTPMFWVEYYEIPKIDPLALFHKAWGYAHDHPTEIAGGYDKAAFGHVQFWLSKVQP